MTLVARCSVLSDVGLRRKTNEDAVVASPPLYAVCDGMGGVQAGEVASALAAETIAATVADGFSLLAAAEAANAAVFARSRADSAHAGMGTTLTALLLEVDTAHFVHVGDSRAYLWRDDGLTQLSDDHSLVAEMVRGGRLTEEEAAIHPHRSVLSRALGTESAVLFDEFVVDLRADDVLLLCSDGLSGPVAAPVLGRALNLRDIDEAARALIREARRQGGPDNITALVLRFEAAPPEAAEVALPAGVAALGGSDLGECGTDDSPDADLSEAEQVAAWEAEHSAARETEHAAQPEAERPAAPQTERPAVSEAEHAAAVQTERPAEPEAQEPVAPEADHPAATQTDRPAAPVAGARRRLRGMWLLVACLSLLVILGLGGSVLISTVFYVSVDEGRLVVYSGLPVKVGPVPLHAVYRSGSRLYSSLSDEERAVVDARDLRGKDDIMDLGRSLGMWP